MLRDPVWEQKELTNYFATLNGLTALFNSMGYSSYLQCSGALLFYNISLGADYHLDLDLRVDASNVPQLADELESKIHLEDYCFWRNINLGRSMITSPHFQFKANGFDIDVASDMDFVVATDDSHVSISIPNSPEWFDETNRFFINGQEIRVATLEMLLIYYLIIDRAKNTGKRDVDKIIRIFYSVDFSYDRFYELLRKYFPPDQQEILKELTYQFASRSASED